MLPLARYHATAGRSHLTIRKSTDNTATWGESLLVQTHNSAGYSCLVNGPLSHNLAMGGLLYEAAGGKIKFAPFPLNMA